MTDKRIRILKELDAAVLRGWDIFDETLYAKILRTLRNPKKAFLRKIIVGFLRQRYVFTLRARTFWGRTIYVNNYEPHLWFCGIIFSPAEIRLTRYLVKHLYLKGAFFDIGSHHGFYALLAHDLSGGSMDIHAFEPAGLHAEVLRKTVHKLPRIRVIESAVCASDGEAIFFENNRTVSTLYEQFASLPSNARLTFKKITIPTITIDSYCAQTGIVPSFMKIDVEGAELDVIRGAEATLTKYSLVIALEVWKHDNKEHLEAVRLLESFGYSAFHILESGDTEQVKNGELLVTNGSEFENILFMRDQEAS